MREKEKYIQMKRNSLISEHKNLVKVLRTKKGLKREAREQAKELREYENE